MKEIRKNSEIMYTLHEDDADKLYFTVTCGGVAMFNVKIELTKDERTCFEREGDTYLDTLARRIQKDSEAFESRAV